MPEKMVMGDFLHPIEEQPCCVSQSSAQYIWEKSIGNEWEDAVIKDEYGPAHDYIQDNMECIELSPESDCEDNTKNCSYPHTDGISLCDIRAYIKQDWCV